MSIDAITRKLGMEWQYVLYSKTYPYRFKVGISSSFSARLENIRATMSSEAGKNVHVALALKMPVFFARKQEQAIQKCMLWRPAANMPGSGFTEWSWSINIYALVLIRLLAYAFDLNPAYTLLALLPLPLDFMLFTLILSLIQYFVVGLAFYGAINVLFL